LENIVFLEALRHGYGVFVGKWGDKEIDFVLEKNGKKKYVQVCYLLSDEKVI
jgi:predicted AAA+ superfamily ATPase